MKDTKNLKVIDPHPEGRGLLAYNKIAKLIGLLESEEIVLVGDERLGEYVKITDSKLKSEYIHDRLIEEQFNEDEIKEFEQFVKKAELTLVHIPDIEGISIDGCIIDSDNLYKSRLWKSLG